MLEKEFLLLALFAFLGLILGQEKSMTGLHRGHPPFGYGGGGLPSHPPLWGGGGGGLP